VRSKYYLWLLALVTVALWAFTIQKATTIFGSSAALEIFIRPISWETYLENQLLEDMNQARVDQGLAPLQTDSILADVARQRSTDMASQGYVGHTSPTGETAFSLLEKENLIWSLAGENIAYNNYPNKKSASVAFSGLMASQKHRQNILYAGYNLIGVAVVISPNGDKYFTTIFAEVENPEGVIGRP